MTIPLVQVNQLVKEFRLPGGWLTKQVKYVRAVDQVNLNIYPGEVFGLVGESGCGKTTVGRLILRLIELTSGSIYFDGIDLSHQKGEDLRRIRKQMQIVFQNPVSSLSPRLKVFDIMAEPIQTHRLIPAKRVPERILEILHQVGLGQQHLDRFPHEMSGGQCQRVAIARALALNPRLMVLDEPTSALDVSVQAQIINLLQDLRTELGLTFLFITHDLSVIQHISDRIGVMYLGRIVESGSTEEIFAQPAHPYTQALLDSIPIPEIRSSHSLTPLKGSIPSPVNPPPGCRFHTRCPQAQECCKNLEPPGIEIHPGHQVACHFAVR